MRTHRSEWSAATTGVPDFVDITDRLQATLDESGVGEGHVTVFSPNRNATLVVNELESGLLLDIKDALTRLGGESLPQGRTMIGSLSIVLPARHGRLRLGMWQRVLLAELEGPAERSVVVQIVGE